MTATTQAAASRALADLLARRRGQRVNKPVHKKKKKTKTTLAAANDDERLDPATRARREAEAQKAVERVVRRLKQTSVVKEEEQQTRQRVRAMAQLCTRRKRSVAGWTDCAGPWELTDVR